MAACPPSLALVPTHLRARQPLLEQALAAEVEAHVVHGAGGAACGRSSQQGAGGLKRQHHLWHSRGGYACVCVWCGRWCSAPESSSGGMQAKAHTKHAAAAEAGSAAATAAQLAPRGQLTATSVTDAAGLAATRPIGSTQAARRAPPCGQHPGSSIQAASKQQHPGSGPQAGPHLLVQVDVKACEGAAQRAGLDRGQVYGLGDAAHLRGQGHVSARGAHSSKRELLECQHPGSSQSLHSWTM